mmetsp:Transcript_30733/g.73277  ORF Transcript_30733/g.73277 Transcript_30733/m.73277 type:complete len:374 (-) Transcript_30733:1945-3066(-)
MCAMRAGQRRPFRQLQRHVGLPLVPHEDVHAPGVRVEDLQQDGVVWPGGPVAKPEILRQGHDFRIVGCVWLDEDVIEGEIPTAWAGGIEGPHAAQHPSLEPVVLLRVRGQHQRSELDVLCPTVQVHHFQQVDGGVGTNLRPHLRALQGGFAEGRPHNVRSWCQRQYRGHGRCARACEGAIRILQQQLIQTHAASAAAAAGACAHVVGSIQTVSAQLETSIQVGLIPGGPGEACREVHLRAPHVRSDGAIRSVAVRALPIREGGVLEEGPAEALLHVDVLLPGLMAGIVARLRRGHQPALVCRLCRPAGLLVLGLDGGHKPHTPQLCAHEHGAAGVGVWIGDGLRPAEVGRSTGRAGRRGADEGGVAEEQSPEG